MRNQAAPHVMLNKKSPPRKTVSRLATAASGRRLNTTHGTMATSPHSTKGEPTQSPKAKMPANTQERMKSDQFSMQSHALTKSIAKKASQGEELRIPERIE